MRTTKVSFRWILWFGDCDVDCIIDGTYTPETPATRIDPPDPAELDIDCVSPVGFTGIDWTDRLTDDMLDELVMHAGVERFAFSPMMTWVVLSDKTNHSGYTFEDALSGLVAKINAGHDARTPAGTPAEDGSHA